MSEMVKRMARCRERIEVAARLISFQPVKTLPPQKPTREELAEAENILSDAVQAIRLEVSLLDKGREWPPAEGNREGRK